MAPPDPAAPDPAAPDEPVDADTVEIVPAPGPVSAPHPAPSYEEVTGYTRSGVPTFDHVRDKIERRSATAIGAQELADALAPEPDPAHDLRAREKAAKARLEEIRRSMGR